MSSTHATPWFPTCMSSGILSSNPGHVSHDMARQLLRPAAPCSETFSPAASGGGSSPPLHALCQIGGALEPSKPCHVLKTWQGPTVSKRRVPKAFHTRTPMTGPVEALPPSSLVVRMPSTGPISSWAKYLAFQECSRWECRTAPLCRVRSNHFGALKHVDTEHVGVLPRLF